MPALTREPAVSGAFYPGDKKDLNSQIDHLLDLADKRELPGRVRMLIVPHAGYEYSGPVAACAYKQVGGIVYQRIIVIGPSHQAYFPGVIVDDRPSWKTPLGVQAVDREGTARLLAGEKGITARPELMDAEHSVEVQIPFIQKVLGAVPFIPVMVGAQDWPTCRMLGEALASAFRGEEVLLVCSTDLYHGHSYRECVATDQYTIEQIEAFNPERLAEALAREEAQACGGGAVVAGLVAAARLGGRRVVTVKHANSSDITGTKGGYVVGYLAAVVLNCPRFNAAEKQEMLNMARRTLEKLVAGEKPARVAGKSRRLDEAQGVFVTLKVKGALRGCIGYIEGVKPLAEAIPAMAAAAAFQDPRFPPLAKNELANVRIEITVLTPLQKIEKPDEIEVGRHGILVKSARGQGLLLPQVATEEGWDRTVFLRHACMKAGLPPDSYLKPDVEIYVFEGEVFGEEG